MIEVGKQLMTISQVDHLLETSSNFKRGEETLTLISLCLKLFTYKKKIFRTENVKPSKIERQWIGLNIDPER